MKLAIFSTKGLVGGVLVESDEVGWLYRGQERVGRIEVDWGGEDQEHIASVIIAGSCAATVVLDRYGQSAGKVTRQYDTLGEVRPEGGGVIGIYRGQQRVGYLQGQGLSSKHMILFGGAGAAVLLNLTSA